VIDASTLRDDRFGYSVYSLVAHASPEQVRKVADVRAQVGMARAAIPAHVTVRGTFHTIESLDDLRGLLCETAAGQERTQVQFQPGGWRFTQDAGGHGGVLRCVTTPGLLALHEAFDAVVRPRSVNAYPDVYRAHLTLCQDCMAEQIERAKALAAGLDLGPGFAVGSVELMGRVGPAFGGEWTLIESFLLADGEVSAPPSGPTG
jgi:2'-5' RNA ligase